MPFVGALLLVRQNPAGGCPPPASLSGSMQTRLVSLASHPGALRAPQETSSWAVPGSLGPTGPGDRGAQQRRGLAPSRGPAKPSEMDKGQQNHHRVPFTLTLEQSALSPSARTPQFTGPFNVPTRSLPTGGQVGGISPILQMVGGIKVTEAGKTTQDSGLPAEWKPTLL